MNKALLLMSCNVGAVHHWLSNCCAKLSSCMVMTELKNDFLNDKRRKSERYKIIVFSFRDTDIV
jgi:hypothetical protein